jgi:hypothetical protein
MKRKEKQPEAIFCQETSFSETSCLGMDDSGSGAFSRNREYLYCAAVVLVKLSSTKLCIKYQIRLKKITHLEYRLYGECEKYLKGGAHNLHSQGHYWKYSPESSG